jgi:hypothetical protein
VLQLAFVVGDVMVYLLVILIGIVLLLFRELIRPAGLVMYIYKEQVAAVTFVVQVTMGLIQMRGLQPGVLLPVVNRR